MRRLVLAAAFCGLACVPAEGQPTPRPLKQLSLEELMSIDVTTVSRRSESIGQAAAAVQVLTAEDIRRSGATTLPQALRLAAGLVMARQNNAGAAIATRGFTSTASNKLLVLIDGRSIYTPLFAGVFWEVQDTLLSDVERIEIIRGPGAALWGSNAVNGVINVILKDAGETRGTELSIASGNEQPAFATVRYGGGNGAAAYRVYGKYLYLDGQKRPNGQDAHDPQRHGQSGFRVDWTPASSRAITIQGDAYNGLFGLNDRPAIEAWGGNVLARWREQLATDSDLQVQAYYDRTHRVVPRQFGEDRGTWSLDAQHRIRRARHDLLWGGSVWLTRDETQGETVRFDPPSRSIVLWSGFAQDEITIAPRRLWLVAGARIEHNSYTGIEVEPTVRVRFTPKAGHTLWAALSRAVRLPTRFDTDLRFVGFGDHVLVFGNPAFQVESAITSEAGYRTRMGPMLSVDVAGFVTKYSDLRSQERLGPAPLPVRLDNLLAANTAGFEVIADFTPGGWFRLQGTYSFLHERFTRAAGSTDVTGGSQEGNDPRHLASIRWSSNLGTRLELDALLRMVSELRDPRVPAYAEASLRFGVRLTPRLELAVVGADLLHDRHPEFGAPAIRDEFERDVSVRLVARF